jgi:hypothetical protein
VRARDEHPKGETRYERTLEGVGGSAVLSSTLALDPELLCHRANRHLEPLMKEPEALLGPRP